MENFSYISPFWIEKYDGFITISVYPAKITKSQFYESSPFQFF